MGCTASTAVSSSEVVTSANSLEKQTLKREGNFGEDFQLGTKLGKGTFGEVRLATEVSSKETHAVKIVSAIGRNDDGSSTNAIDKKRLDRTMREVNVWEALGESQHIVTMMCYYYKKEGALFHMVMERCSCSLSDMLVEGQLSEQDMALTFRHMLLGLRHIHSKQIMHRDMKPDNILYQEGVGDSSFTVKICDFGFACRIPQDGENPIRGPAGTAPYLSPEMVNHIPYNHKTDIWSFGAIAYFVTFGHFPYLPTEKTIPAMKKAIRMDRPAINFTLPLSQRRRFSAAFVDRVTQLLRVTLQRCSYSRPSATDSLQLPLVTSGVCGALGADVPEVMKAEAELTKDIPRTVSMMEFVALYETPSTPKTKPERMVNEAEEYDFETAMAMLKANGVHAALAESASTADLSSLRSSSISDFMSVPTSGSLPPMNMKSEGGSSNRASTSTSSSLPAMPSAMSKEMCAVASTMGSLPAISKTDLVQPMDLFPEVNVDPQHRACGKMAQQTPSPTRTAI